MIHIKELAEQTNITVRTLRYYEQIELLISSSKTVGGHRLYTEEDLQKLQEIQFYKSLGYSLSDIKMMLTDSEWNWTAGLVKQLTYITNERSRLKEMEQLLRTAISGLALEKGNQEQVIQNLIKLTMQDKRNYERFKEQTFNEAELHLWGKLPKMNADNPESMEWIGLIGMITKYHRTQVSPSSDSVQNVIRRMLEKQKDEYQGEDAFLDKLWEMRKSPTESEQLGLYPIDVEVLEYMEQAYNISMKSQQSSIDTGGDA
ncbi:MerR family transcriptional regulator [Paenibacillus sp. Root52]|uniref:DNA-binding transcriptional MerR regulator n=1 Tax=Paenibacillus amylolyticus TaxID=1451 RepID=A0AAP5H1Z8_PAEAM|nr:MULTISPECIES: MerR family transcriptional regulator [Paenibacillus]KQY94540.1 MerR family transcriptional regulator [Paenibacillus sp. Root52]MDR6724352.1 DNA-binding transcriptional MerR regulator [Paenibacillus amylolyticus]